MKDPKRLLDGDGTDFERALLRAVVTERPSRDLRRKMRLGIGLVGGAAVTKTASASWNQLAMAGVVVAGLVTGGAIIAQREPAPRAAVSAKAPAPVAREAKPVEAIAEKVGLPVEPRVEPERAPTPAPKPAVAPDIREEIRLLDQARTAVRGGESARALRTLAIYDQRFPRGQFRQEVLVLRIEALRQNGDPEQARALAKRFVAEHPNSPHVERVQKSGTK